MARSARPGSRIVDAAGTRAAGRAAAPGRPGRPGPGAGTVLTGPDYVEDSRDAAAHASRQALAGSSSFQLLPGGVLPASCRPRYGNRHEGLCHTASLSWWYD